MTKATLPQRHALLTALLKDSPYTLTVNKPVNKQTWDVIVRNDWYDDEKGQITLEGMKAANIPIVQQPCIKLTRKLTYTHPYQKEKGGKVCYKTLTLLPETVIMVTWRGNLDAKRRFIEGYVNIDGQQLFVRMYEPMRCEATTIPVPNMEELLEKGIVYEQRL